MDKPKKKLGVAMNQCFECDCIGFIEEKQCDSCGSNRLMEVLVTQEEYDFHYRVSKMDLEEVTA